MNQSAESYVEDALVKAILNRKYPVGSFLPPERELANLLGYSRPVIHKAIIRLEGKGLVTIRPRQGVVVNDYRMHGKLELLEHLYSMYRDAIDPEIVKSSQLLVQRNLHQLLHELMQGDRKGHQLCKTGRPPIDSGEDVFRWIQEYALQSDNVLYAMLFNEFKRGIINVAQGAIDEDLTLVRQLVCVLSDAIDARDTDVFEHASSQLFDTLITLWMKGGRK